MDGLSKLLMQERKQLQAINQAEDERMQVVDDMFNYLHLTPTEKTISELMNYIDNEEDKIELDKTVTTLVNVIVALKQTEQLNNELIQQSMQFVQLSLDMLQPSAQTINYTNKNEKQATTKRSVFDSKA